MVIYFITNANKNKDLRYTNNSETSLDILKKRLAMGEITTYDGFYGNVVRMDFNYCNNSCEEYNKLKNELTK